MKYEVTRLVCAHTPIIPIDKLTFETIRDAHNGMFSVLRIEFDYNVLIGNWMDLEKAAFALALEGSVRRTFKRVEFDRAQMELDRRVANLLSSARAFIDHTSRAVASLPGLTAADQRCVKGLFSAQHDGNVSYRIVEALRNYAQHSGSPTQGISFESRWVKEGEEEKFVAGVSVYLNPDRLASDPKFNRSVLAELVALKEKEIAVIPIIRDYVECLSTVVGQLREFLRTRMEVWSRTIDGWITRYGELSQEPDRMWGLAAIETSDDGRKVLQEVHLSVEFKERIAGLQHLNRPLVNLHKRQVRI